MISAEVRVDISGFDTSSLPSPPRALARIVQMASNPEVSATQLGEVISGDAAFTSELLRTVNSPFYGLRTPVQDAARAVAILGLRALRNLAVCFVVREAIQHSGVRTNDMNVFWEDALRRAVVARAIARLGNQVRPDEAFTVGLLQEIGMLAILRVDRERFKLWGNLRSLPPDERLAVELQRFRARHDVVGEQLARAWGLPDTLIAVLANHHQSERFAAMPPQEQHLCRLAWMADQVAVVFSARQPGIALAAVRGLLLHELKLNSSGIDNLLRSIPGEVEEAASALGLRASQQVSFDDVLKEANQTLVNINLSYEQVLQQLEQANAALEQALREKALLAEELARLAYYDPLTGLATRRKWEEMSVKELKRLSQSGQPLSVVLIDLDHFKKINDTYGHPFGDVVLRSLGQLLRKLARNTDTIARIGGEEIAILLPETDAATAMRLAETWRQEIGKMPLTAPRGIVKVTASFGGVSCAKLPTTIDEPETMMTQLIESADHALYQSKAKGRNRVIWAP